MPYKHAVKVSEEVYRRLWELVRQFNLESPNQLLEKLLLGEGGKGRGYRSIPIYKAITSGGEVAYVITLDGVSITLTHTELRALCKSGLVDVTLCSKTVLA
jgi:hypothetical protein